jgi:hypothetical protein
MGEVTCGTIDSCKKLIRGECLDWKEGIKKDKRRVERKDAQYHQR